MKLGLLYLHAKTYWRGYLTKWKLSILRNRIISRAKKNRKEPGILVSFTTFPARANQAHLVILSVLAGEKLPEKIVLYVCRTTHEMLANRRSIIQMVNSGLVQLRIVQDVRSYTKLVYAIQEFVDACIVICDDDTAYPEYWLADLLNSRAYDDKKTIVSSRAHRVIRDAEGKMMPYSTWKREIGPGEQGSDIFPTGTGGVLYPPGSMPSLTWNRDLFQTLAPTADDVWFWYCARQNECTFKTTETRFQRKLFVDLPGSQSINLHHQNVACNANDLQIAACERYF